MEKEEKRNVFYFSWLASWQLIFAYRHFLHSTARSETMFPKKNALCKECRCVEILRHKNCNAKLLSNCKITHQQQQQQKTLSSDKFRMNSDWEKKLWLFINTKTHLKAIMHCTFDHRSNCHTCKIRLIVCILRNWTEKKNGLRKKHTLTTLHIFLLLIYTWTLFHFKTFQLSIANESKKPQTHYLTE